MNTSSPTRTSQIVTNRPAVRSARRGAMSISSATPMVPSSEVV
jgi:hypothetical protein